MTANDSWILAVSALAYIVGVLVLRAALTYSVQRSERPRGEK